jgi:hypothetical protein
LSANPFLHFPENVGLQLGAFPVRSLYPLTRVRVFIYQVADTLAAFDTKLGGNGHSGSPAEQRVI